MRTNNAKNIAVAQLTRIGDVVQTWEAARTLKKDHPEAKLFLVARKGMAKGLDFLLKDVFHEVIYIDVKDFIPSKNSALAESLSNTKATLSKIKSWNLDLFVNLSFNKSSSYLTALACAKFKMGISRNEMNQLAVGDKWSQYIYSTVMNGDLNPFNLVDIYKFILGAKTYEPEYEERERQDLIVVHPFASHRKKRWGSHRWVDLIYKVLKENPEQEVRIVGGPQDKKDALAIMESPALKAHKERILDHTGDFSIEQTYDLLTQAKLLICHDSMVSHLAAASHTPTVVLSLGTVRPSETTPYQRNVINIAPKRDCFPCALATPCDLQPCHKDLSHQLVGQVVNAILREQTLGKAYFQKSISPFYLNNVSVFAPHFGETGMELIDIAEGPVSAKDAFKTIYRILWSFYLRGVDANMPMPAIDQSQAALLASHKEGCEQMFELYSFAMKFAKDVLKEARSENPNINKIQEHIKKLSEIDQLSVMTKKNHQLLRPIVDFFFVNKANAVGNNIIDITESNLLSLHEGQNLIKILFDLLNSVVGTEESDKVKEV